MPSTRGGGRYDTDPVLLSDSEDDPSYHESTSEEEDCPQNMRRDRAQWVVDNVEVVEELFRAFKADGRGVFGEAFFQLGSAADFAHFIYRYTMPGYPTTSD